MKRNSIAFIGNYEPLTAQIFNFSKRNYNLTIFINLSDSRTPKSKSIFRLKIHEFQKIINLLNKYGIKNICLIGKIHRPNLKNLNVDRVLSKYINQLLNDYQKGDDQVLRSIITILRGEGFIINSLKDVDKNYYFKSDQGELIFKKNDSDLDDVIKGKYLLNSISKFDNAQSAVISNGYILGIECVEGTDSLLKRVAKEKKNLNLIKSEGILVKISKKYQSSIIDNPVIGKNTILNLIKANLNGLAISRKNTIIFDKKNVFKLLQENKKNLYFI